MEKNKISLGLKSPPISEASMADAKDARIQAEDRKKGAAQDALRTEGRRAAEAEGRRAAEAEAQARAQAQKRRNDYDKDQQLQDKDRERGAAEDALRAERRRAAEAEARAAQAQAQANKSSDQITPGKPGTVILEPLPKGSQPLGIQTSNPFGTVEPLLPIPTGRGKAPSLTAPSLTASSLTAPTSTTAVVDTRTEAQLKEDIIRSALPLYDHQSPSNI